MSDPEDIAPLTIELDADDIQRLWDGETLEVLAEERSETSVDYLEIELYTKGVLSGTAREVWPGLFQGVAD